MTLTILWFLVFLGLLLIELLTVNLVSIWFVVGSIAALITSFFTDSVLLQLVLFLVVSVISLLVMKPFTCRFKSFSITPTNSDRVIGKSAVVLKRIEKNKYGEVKVLGTVWTACSEEVIAIGSKVKILGIDGVKLIVKKEEI